MMRKRNIFRYAAVLGSAAVLLASLSCSRDDSEISEADKPDDSPVMFRAVPTVSENDIQVDTRAPGDDDNKYLLDEKMWNFISNSSFKDGITRIRLRLATTSDEGWNFLSTYYEYIYSKELEDRTTHDADGMETVYNFTPWSDNDGQYKGEIGPGMTWSQIDGYSVNGSTDVFAALFAQTYDATTAQTISQNQNTANDIINNDVLLAWHSVNNTDRQKQYFTLQLYHVYSMLAVEVEIPIYDPTDGLGFDETPTKGETLRIDDSENPNTPLTTDSPIQKLEVTDQRLKVIFGNGQLQNAIPSVKINDSEEQEPQDINMCLLAVSPPEEDKNPAYADKGFKIQKYLYACILPASNASSGTASNTAVRLTIKNPLNGTTETYTCNTFNAPAGSSDAFTLVQGTITLLDLTLARGAKNPVLVTGKVLPWGTANADLGLMENGPGTVDSRPKKN